jgi:hypothetical protein
LALSVRIADARNGLKWRTEGFQAVIEAVGFEVAITLGRSARHRHAAWHYGRNRRGQPDQATTLARFLMRLDVRQSPHRLFVALFDSWFANSKQLARW